MIRRLAPIALPLATFVGLVWLSTASAALAEETAGGHFYVEARGGMAAPQTVNLNDIDVGSQVASEIYGVGDLEYKVGGTVFLAAGYQITNSFRAEVEISWRTAQYDEIDYRDTPDLDLSGNATSLTSMANGYYDIRLRADQPIVPYLGAGLGVGCVRWDPSFPGTSGLDEKQVRLAWNAGFGLLWNVVPSVGLTVGYRYVGTTKLEFDLTTGENVELPFGMHETTLGVRYTF